MFHRSRALLAVLLIVAAGFTSTLSHAADSFRATSLADNIHLVAGPAGNTLVAIDSDGIV